jgi:hypothetical protein
MTGAEASTGWLSGRVVLDAYISVAGDRRARICGAHG